MFKIIFKSLLALFILFSIFSCESDRRAKKDMKTTDNTEIVITNTTQSDSIEKINFYFENSGSMNGYLDGKNFKQTMHRIIDEDKDGFKPFFVNMEEYKTSNLLLKIDNKNIKTNLKV
ncbi:hypothetical protein OAD06_05470 [Flavobacteriaceae bacterium]|nr:hypothetical protein [bacterium]MDB9913732.1 hypothetical protein [Flavobacteriaceae bacterium]